MNYFLRYKYFPILVGAAVKGAFAIGDISEGLSGYSHVSSCDTSPPSNIIKDMLFFGNQELYLYEPKIWYTRKELEILL